MLPRCPRGCCTLQSTKSDPLGEAKASDRLRGAMFLLFPDSVVSFLLLFLNWDCRTMALSFFLCCLMLYLEESVLRGALTNSLTHALSLVIRCVSMSC